MRPPVACLHDTNNNMPKETECPPGVPTKAIVGKVTLAKEVLPVVLLMETLGSSACSPQKGWILEELNLQALEEWPEAEQQQARQLLLKWEYLFACSDPGHGKNIFD